MYTVKLFNEFLHGPIWVYASDGISLRHFPLFDNDPVLSELNNKAMDMYDSYFEFDSHDVACWFNEEKEKLEKPQMLDIFSKIRTRLNEINDGSFVIADYESDGLK